MATLLRVFAAQSNLIVCNVQIILLGTNDFIGTLWAVFCFSQPALGFYMPRLPKRFLNLETRPPRSTSV